MAAQVQGSEPGAAAHIQIGQRRVSQGEGVERRVIAHVQASKLRQHAHVQRGQDVAVHVDTLKPRAGAQVHFLHHGEGKDQLRQVREVFDPLHVAYVAGAQAQAGDGALVRGQEAVVVVVGLVPDDGAEARVREMLRVNGDAVRHKGGIALLGFVDIQLVADPVKGDGVLPVVQIGSTLPVFGGGAQARAGQQVQAGQAGLVDLQRPDVPHHSQACQIGAFLDLRRDQLRVLRKVQGGEAVAVAQERHQLAVICEDQGGQAAVVAGKVRKLCQLADVQSVERITVGPGAVLNADPGHVGKIADAREVGDLRVARGNLRHRLPLRGVKVTVLVGVEIIIYILLYRIKY